MYFGFKLRLHLSSGYMKTLKYLLVAVLGFPITVMACSFDSDCSPGSKCAKAIGEIYGVCEGGVSPGNSYDRQPPVHSPYDINGTYGNTCSFSTDCGPGSVCEKKGGVKGVCTRNK
jgi:hypothetical protein